MIAIRRGLQRQIMLVFAGFTFLVTLLFALYAVAFVYTVEDHFLMSQMVEESAYLKRVRADTGAWPAPRNRSMRVYIDTVDMPSVVREGLRQESSRRKFSSADGRSFRLLPISEGTVQSWLLYEVSERSVVRPIRGQIFFFLGWSGLVALVVSLILGAWLAQRISAPLSRLADAVERMQPNDLPERLHTGMSNDEVGVLARGLEQLIRRIRAFIAREQEFTRDASHELRTPLAVIRMAGERLSAEPGLSDVARNQLDNVLQSAAQLEQTVTTLLALAREQMLEAGAERTRLLPVIERVIIEQSPLIGDRPIVVEVDVPQTFSFPKPIGVMHILLSNLIGNAFAHTARGEVWIDVEGDRLRIANHGVAFDPNMPAEIGRPFRKREGSAGFGLGLAIVKRLCDRYAIEMRIDHDETGTVASIRCEAAD
ncbi:MAG: HAMP domain-containing histidine kinase [Lysobacter sp.]|nr:HAMP domain-containing histidine kinase [Lysobacter sp.]